ncbi:protein CBFA2T3 [Chrysoperla carnea]|uniref:protein CBFA2T3 n=1 Tax=Chrysoperla carnea TaxID=189513 RepID=UPI001D070F1F|nr:protein CBFA2T3 [Chrysoperla carnea]
MIKEEVPDKDFPDTDRISSLRSRNKGGIVTSLTTNNGKTQQQTDRLTNCKTPDSPEGARLSSSNSSTSSLGGSNNVSTSQQQSQSQQQSTTLSSQQQLNSSLSPNHQSQSSSTPNNTNLVSRHHSPPRITTQLGVVVTTNGGALSPSTMPTHMTSITSGGPTLLHHHRASTSPDTVNNLVVTTTPPLSLTVDHNTAAVTSQQNSGGGGGGGVSGGGISTLSTTNHNNNNYLNYNPLRQLNKVKRFLCTLVQFGADIGPDIGDRVRSMVLSLVSSNLSIEEFHQALQDVTNFPLRPFVLPFLRAHLPLLQREVHNLARASKQSTLQYVRTHDHIVLDPTFSPSEASEIFFSNEQQQQTSIIAPKRRASDSFYENGIPSNGSNSLITSTIPTQQSNESNHEYNIPSKRQITSQYYQQNPFLLSTAGTIPAPNISTHASTFFLPTNATTNLPTIGGGGGAGTLQTQIVDPYANTNTNHVQSATMTPAIPNKIENDSNENSSYRHFSTNLLCGNNNGSNRGDEEWKNIHVMLNCILSMVEKTKRALTILQQRNGQDQTNDWLRKQDIGIDFKKAANEIMIQAIRQTEDRVAEVKRKAEEAVSEVKKQAVIELQKAVQLAETKACELVANERAKMEKILLDVRKKSTDDVLLSQHDVHDNSQSPPINAQPATSSQNSCWNCGRKANETCSGCNVARYCGAFCQHKDWENHHAVCCQQNTLSASKLASILNPNNNSNKLSNLQSNPSNPTQITKPSRNDTCTTNRSSTPVSSTNSRNSSRDTDRNSSIISK